MTKGVKHDPEDVELYGRWVEAIIGLDDQAEAELNAMDDYDGELPIFGNDYKLMADRDWIIKHIELLEKFAEESDKRLEDKKS